jgi:hypothetical protein
MKKQTKITTKKNKSKKTAAKKVVVEQPVIKKDNFLVDFFKKIASKLF